MHCIHENQICGENCTLRLRLPRPVQVLSNTWVLINQHACKKSFELHKIDQAIEKNETVEVDFKASIDREFQKDCTKFCFSVI